MLFSWILVCLIIFCLQACLIHNFCLKGDKMSKPLLLAFFSCQLSIISSREFREMFNMSFKI
jgi:hypothetical protein